MTYLIKSRSDKHFYTTAVWQVSAFNELIAGFKIKCAPGYRVKDGFVVPINSKP